MQLPKLTPLQSRFAASFFASAIILFLYFGLNRPTFAYAAEIDSRIPDDHNHPIILDTEFNDWEEQEDSANRISILESRAPAGVSALANNAPQNMNIEAGQTQNWVLPETVVNGPHGEVGPGLPSENITGSVETARGELRKRDDETTIYITINTCLQPSSTSQDSDEVVPPQLLMYLSTDSSNELPGPSGDSGQQTPITVDGGYAIVMLNTSSSVYVGISAPDTTAFSGIWNYEIAGSIDAPYHSANSTWTNLFFVDGDNHAALLISGDTTEAPPGSTLYEEWMNIKPPYGMFAQDETDPAIMGVRNSYCGLKNNAQILANLESVENQNVADMTNRGLGGQPKEQFYITALNASSNYWGWLALQGNSTASGNGVVGGGGTVFAYMNFSTKAENNCALLYNLSFCSEVAYAVPSNPNKFSASTGLPALAALYDDYAAEQYTYFDYSLQQIPCNTTSSAQYSLARTCTDCARAYKQWLCAVTIPRCEDFSNDSPYLLARNTAQPFINGSMALIDSHTLADEVLLDSVATNSSRNALIDTYIQPGPYKEVLPCEDLCYDLVQSCPAVLGFGCPYPGRGLELSYGTRSLDSGVISCSYLGAAYYLSAAERTGALAGLQKYAPLAVAALGAVWLSA